VSFFEAFMDELSKMGGTYVHFEKRWPKDQDPDHNDTEEKSNSGSGPPLSWTRRRGRDTNQHLQRRVTE
jgi:hypothetical protein